MGYKTSSQLLSGMILRALWGRQKRRMFSRLEQWGGESGGVPFNEEQTRVSSLKGEKRRSWHPVHHFMANRWGNNGNSDRFYFLGLKITADGDCRHEINRCLLLGRKAVTNLDSILKKQRHYLADKGLSSQSCGFSSSHVWIWELDHKEMWVPKNWCFWAVVLEMTLESPLDCKEIQLLNPKGNQS